MAAAIYEGKQATFNQSYGPEARGSACSAQIVVADELIHFPYEIRLQMDQVLMSVSSDD